MSHSITKLHLQPSFPHTLNPNLYLSQSQCTLSIAMSWTLRITYQTPHTQHEKIMVPWIIFEDDNKTYQSVYLSAIVCLEVGRVYETMNHWIRRSDLHTKLCRKRIACKTCVSQFGPHWLVSRLGVHVSARPMSMPMNVPQISWRMCFLSYDGTQLCNVCMYVIALLFLQRQQKQRKLRGRKNWKQRALIPSLCVNQNKTR